MRDNPEEGAEPRLKWRLTTESYQLRYPRPFFLISIFSRRIFWFRVESGT